MLAVHREEDIVRLPVEATNPSSLSVRCRPDDLRPAVSRFAAATALAHHDVAPLEDLRALDHAVCGCLQPDDAPKGTVVEKRRQHRSMPAVFQKRGAAGQVSPRLARPQPLELVEPTDAGVLSLPLDLARRREPERANLARPAGQPLENEPSVGGRRRAADTPSGQVAPPVGGTAGRRVASASCLESDRPSGRFKDAHARTTVSSPVASTPA